MRLRDPMDTYDVIVVGAGPAGLNCAEKLAKAGKKTLLLEKKSEIGPKVCAGGITAYNMDYLQLPENLIGRSFKEIKVHSAFKYGIIKMDEDILFTVDRSMLGKWLLDRLKKIDIDIRTGSRVTRIGRDYVEINDSRKIYFKNLVGADGSSSVVRKHLGLNSNQNGFGMQYLIRTDEFNELEIFFDTKLFHSWYAWIFPHENFVSIGCGCNPKYVSINKQKENFHIWLDLMNIDISSEKFQLHPINHNYLGFRFDNIYLAGDSAGLASGLTGEGIYQALISGEDIAKVIIDNAYAHIKLNEIIKSLQFHDLVKAFLERSGPFRLIEFEILTGIIIKSFLIKGPFKKFYP